MCICVYACVYVERVCEWQVPVFLKITSFEEEELKEDREEGSQA